MLRWAWGTLLKLVLVLCVAGAFVAGWIVLRSPDPEYAAYETLFNRRFHRYDGLIRDAASRHGVDPMVVKAVVWRESRFDPTKKGLDEERGLMQITDAAAREWIKSEKVSSYAPNDLFDPKVNIEAGTWLLARALRRYEGKDNPLPFALAEYNAGRSRVYKWSGERDSRDGTPPPTSSRELVANIDIPSTRNYIETVQNRVQFYRRRGRL